MTPLSAVVPIRSAPVLRIKVRTSKQHGGRFGTANAAHRFALVTSMHRSGSF
ncbi:hypothetical protein ABIB68_007226 [Bradyrhizobium sp. F1.2.2]